MIVSLVDTIDPAMLTTARTPLTPAITGHVPCSQYTFPVSDLEMQPSLIFPHTLGSNQRTSGHRIKLLDRACHNAHGHLVPDWCLRSSISVTPPQNNQRRPFPRQCHTSLAKHLFPNTTLPLFHSLLSSGYELTAVLLPHCLPHIPNLPPMPHQHSNPAIPSPSSCLTSSFS